MFFPIQVDTEDLERNQRFAVCTYALLVLLVGVHVAMVVFLGPVGRQDIYYRFGVVAHDYHWWSVFTCTVLHAGWLHLIGNGYFLWLYGRTLELRLRWWALLLIYLAGAFVSTNIHVLTLSPLAVDQPLIGASGAVSAVLGAFLVLLPTQKMTCLLFNPFSFRPLVVEIPAAVVLGLWFLGQLGWTLGIFGVQAQIAFWAHVAGFTAGAALASGLRFVGHRQHRQSEAELRRPFVEAWQSAMQERWGQAAKHYAALPAERIHGQQGSQILLEACLAARDGQSEGAMPRFIKAFCQARDYRDEAKLLTVYVQMLRRFPPAEIPAFIHRDAGLSAHSLKHPQLAAWALGHALADDIEERRPQVAAAIAALGERLQRPELGHAARQMQG